MRIVPDRSSMQPVQKPTTSSSLTVAKDSSCSACSRIRLPRKRGRGSTARTKRVLSQGYAGMCWACTFAVAGEKSPFHSLTCTQMSPSSVNIALLDLVANWQEWQALAPSEGAKFGNGQKDRLGQGAHHAENHLHEMRKGD